MNEKILFDIKFSGKPAGEAELFEDQLEKLRKFGEAHKGNVNLHHVEDMEYIEYWSGPRIRASADLLRKEFGLILKVFGLDIEKGHVCTECHVFGLAAWDAFKAENSWLTEE